VSTGDQERGSWTAEARISSLRPPAPRVAHETWSLPELDQAKPAKNPLDCIRHDAGSAVHSLHGFVDLLSMGAFGPMTEEQLRSIHHLKGAAQRLFELIESSLELTQPGLGPAVSELRVTSLARLVRGIVHSSARERSGVAIELETPADANAEVAVTVDPESFVRMLNLLFDVLVESGRASFSVRVREYRGQAVVELSAEREEQSVTQSIPMQRIALGEVDHVSEALSNRCYLQLKRCEALIKRQGGSLQLLADLARLRVALPLARER
jgi:light-regulated signal transduction histidine kinase (bacteriophytochrome)